MHRRKFTYIVKKASPSICYVVIEICGFMSVATANNKKWSSSDGVHLLQQSVV